MVTLSPYFPNNSRAILLLSLFAFFAFSQVAHPVKYFSPLRARGIRSVIDHFIPLARGGTSEESNLVFCCDPCNKAKSDDIWERKCREGFYEYKD